MQNKFSRYIPIAVIIGIIAIIGLWTLSSYNSLEALHTSTNSQWVQVEKQYQRRFDTMFNYLATVASSMKKETNTFTALGIAGQEYARAQTQEEKIVAVNQLEFAFERLLVVSENYPVLKSNKSVQSLKIQLIVTENSLSVERMKYNDMVLVFNNRIKTFPGSTFAKYFGFKPKKLF